MHIIDIQNGQKITTLPHEYYVLESSNKYLLIETKETYNVYNYIKLRKILDDWNDLNIYTGYLMYRKFFH